MEPQLNQQNSSRVSPLRTTQRAMTRNVCRPTPRKALLAVVFSLLMVTVFISRSSTGDDHLEFQQGLNFSAKDGNHQVRQARKSSTQDGDRQVLHAPGPESTDDKRIEDRKPERNSLRTTPGKTDYDRWLQKQVERKALVKKVCEAENIDAAYRGQQVIDPSLLTQLKVDDKHKIIYCYVPKAACTSWKSMFIRLSGDFDPDHPEAYRRGVHNDKFLAQHGLKPLRAYSASSRTKRLQTYTKFMVVRHPYQRLVSAFQDKFRVFDAAGKVFQKHYGGQMIKMYRENASAECLATGQNATFSEFLRFLGDETVPEYLRIDPHWRPFQKLCHPCVIDYDFIAKTETLEEDSSYILEKAFHTQLRLQALHSIGRTNTSYFDGIPESIMRNLDKLFLNDLKMFDYEWPLYKSLHTSQ